MAVGVVKMPVRLVVGDVDTTVGDIELEIVPKGTSAAPGIKAVLAGFLREMADAVERVSEEDDDAAADG